MFSPDTDVILLLIHWYPQLCPNTRFLTGKGITKRIIPVQPLYVSLGNERAKAILAFHAFSGADTTGRFAGKTKASCFKTFMAAGTHIHQAFASMGIEDPSSETMKALERFVCLLYSPKTLYQTTSELRWHLFTQKHAEGEKLLPTFGTLRPHVLRAHYVTML